MLRPPPKAAKGEENESIELGKPVNNVVRLMQLLLNELDPESLSNDESTDDVRKLPCPEQQIKIIERNSRNIHT